MKALLSALALLALGCLPASALKIELRYDYDTNGFFNQPGAKAALRAVADFYESLLHDTLLPINQADFPGSSWSPNFTHPGTGASVSIPGLVVPQDILIIYAGGRNLGGPAGRGGAGGYSASGTQDWFNRLKGRGQAGVLTSPVTDVAPWGGTITFDTSTTWNFATSGPASGSPFLSVALHEFGHVLGIGASDAWRAKISGSVFTGPLSRTAFGRNVPVQAGGSHWQDDENCELPDGYVPGAAENVLSKAYGLFGVPHGYPQIALMDPSTCSAGPFYKVMTDLDLAALRDIGWQLEPPLRFLTAQGTFPAATYAFTWPSTTGISYRLQRSTTLAAGSWSDLSTLAGNGGVLSYNAAAVTGPRAFFRLNTNTGSSLQAAAAAVAPVTVPAPSSAPEEIVEGCHFSSSWGYE